MKRSFLVFLGLAILAAAVAKGTAAPSGPVGLQYDEIVRVAAGTTTPPPPGAFENDLSAIVNGSQTTPAAKPAAKKRGLGNLIGAVLSGNAADVVVDAATQKVVDNAVGGMMGSLNAFRDFMQAGKLERHAFYKGWERVDDVAAKTATIKKCDLNQYIELNLEKKTYHITNPTGGTHPASSGSHASNASTETPAPEQPGTAVVDFTRKGTALAAQTLSGVQTTGYSNRNSLTVSQATGSCRNGSFTLVSTEYMSAMKQPRAVCPLPASPRVPMEPKRVVARGGCKPTFTVHNSGPVAPSGRLAMYTCLAFLPQNSNDEAASQFAFVTERGNVKSLSKADAALFEIPAGFTPEP